MRTIYTLSLITKELETKLWKDALIVFDTCALMDFYFLTEEYQKIMSDILLAIEDRIWIPAHVKYEFEKNHEKGLFNPIVERYTKTNVEKNKFVEELESLIKQWDTQYEHPFIKGPSLQKIKDTLQEIKPKIKNIKSLISKQYQDRKKEIGELHKKDVIGKTVARLNCGNPFSFAEIRKIAEEGKIRFANQIPPGYKDSETKNGIRQYGDLIIWKEILRKAKEDNRDIILISSDKKADWIITDETKQDKFAEKPNPKEKDNPRRELLVEFEEETGHNLWIYSTTSFIAKLEELYKPSEPILEFHGKLGVVRDVIERLAYERDIRHNASDTSLLIRCNNCGELFAIDVNKFEFDWQHEESEDRSIERDDEYVSYEKCQCPLCKQKNDIELHVWKYPKGLFNNQDIEISHGSIEKTVNLSSFIQLNDYDVCIRCGERAIINEFGLCECCQEEFDKFVNSDD